MSREEKNFYFVMPKILKIEAQIGRYLDMEAPHGISNVQYRVALFESVNGQLPPEVVIKISWGDLHCAYVIPFMLVAESDFEHSLEMTVDSIMRGMFIQLIKAIVGRQNIMASEMMDEIE